MTSQYFNDFKAIDTIASQWRHKQTNKQTSKQLWLPNYCQLQLFLN